MLAVVAQDDLVVDLDPGLDLSPQDLLGLQLLLEALAVQVEGCLLYTSRCV